MREYLWNSCECLLSIITSYKSLHRLLGTEDYERSGAEEEATHVGGDVVDGDDGHGEDIPNHAVTQS